MRKIRYRPHPLLAYPTQPVFLALLVSIPFLIMGALWRDGLLSTTTVAAAFDGTALLCLVMPVTSAWRAAAMEREYRGYLQVIADELSAPNLDDKRRQQLLVERSKLDDQFHFVHDRQGTLQKVKVIGVGMRLASRYLRKINKYINSFRLF
ncbi:hypothetical protein [Pseudomonas arsenicoxydans]|uniref:Uncharacterized protein n=1 Tax=Pseudomonas arsenicoxydans TaxID=702115 RepID=A0A502HMG9_9PSED|nr:hypothetical protein [Pseudomonas arsenicoxydans]TPG74606.1 hypothetical protein EAH78_23885 [Pseudomonas arsenicoxydans]